MNATGVALGSRNEASKDEMIALAQLADKLGYSSLWVGESWGCDAFTLLSMIACHTSTIRLGTGIVPVYSRTPALIAQSIASLDIISGGRAILGLGTSGRILIEQWHGQKFDHPLERTREYINIIRMALAGQRLDHQGRFFNLQRFRMLFAPIQERIPIYVAALGPKNLELADGWLPVWVDAQHLAEMKRRVEQCAIKVGRSASEVAVAPQVLAMATFTQEQRDEALGLLRAHMAYYIGGMGQYYYDLFRRCGYEEESRLVSEAWERGDRQQAAALISDQMLDNFTIVGDPDECRQKLAEYRAAGADMPIISFPHGATTEVAERTLKALAPA